MRKRLYNIILLLTGQVLIYLLMSLSFAVTFLYLDYSNEFILKTIAVASLLRFFFYLTRSIKPAFCIQSIRKKINRTIEDEARVGISLAAFCLFSEWNVLTDDLLIALAVNFIAQFIGLFITNKIMSYLATKNITNYSNQQILIIGTGKNGKHTADVILDSPESKSHLAGFMDFHRKGLWRYRDIPMIGHPDELAVIIANSHIDLIICALENEDTSLAHSIFETADTMGTPICYMPNLAVYHNTKIKPTYINSLPAMLYRKVPDNQLKLFIKSFVDKIGAVVGIVLFSPIMLLTALAIKIEDRGPVFFNQIRSGINGKQFRLFKFRTMCVNAEQKKAELEKLNEMSGPVFKITNDPRVTKVGCFLRKTSMDELPQFFNVLFGNMSLVGPRPPLPKEVAQYEQWQHRRLSVKPGVTCTWQINGRNNIDFNDWMKLDLDYIDNWSLWNDTKIIAKTIPAVIKGSGAS